MPRQIKALLFVALWHEMAGQFTLGLDGAFLATAFVVWGHVWLRRTALEVAGLSQPLTAAFVWGGVIWLYLYLWLAPEAIHRLPLTLIAGGLGVLVLLGFQARLHLMQSGEKSGKAWLRERSEAIALVLLVCIFAAFVARRQWGSALPLIGYIALFVLPFSFGWMGAGPQLNLKHDARFGDAKMFRDAGVSDDY